MPRSLDELDSPVSPRRKRAVRTRVRATRSRQTTTEKSHADREDSFEPVAPPPARKTKPEPKIDKTEKRKAPTTLANARALATQKRRQLLVVMVILGIGIGSSAMVGFTDEGQINVQKTIEDRNERIRNNQATESDLRAGTLEIPVQKTAVQKADGGLVGRGVGTVPAPTVVPPVATSSPESATSSDAVATTTESEIADSEEPEKPAGENVESEDEQVSPPEAQTTD